MTDPAPKRPVGDWNHVSTGVLPESGRVAELVERAHAMFRTNTDGKNSQVYPALARVPSELFGVCVVGTSGQALAAGDADYPFAIMSVSKPFVFALLCERLGPDHLRQFIGVNATGLPFNSLAAVEQSADGRTNPMVNSGAIAVTSLTPGESLDEQWNLLLSGLSEFAGRPLKLNEEVFESAMKTNFRNQGIADLLYSLGRLGVEPARAIELYTLQCSLDVTARDLAVMGATLAAGGVNPLTGQTIVDPMVCHYSLAVMATAGLYETSGDWLYEVGLPGKSGIGGGIVTVSPGKGALGTFAPPLDAAGNSVRGQLAARFLSQHLGMDLFLSRPVR
ncbi:MAG: glutaminase A [Pirellulales bacterium]